MRDLRHDSTSAHALAPLLTRALTRPAVGVLACARLAVLTLALSLLPGCAALLRPATLPANGTDATDTTEDGTPTPDETLADDAGPEEAAAAAPTDGFAEAESERAATESPDPEPTAGTAEGIAASAEPDTAHTVVPVPEPAPPTFVPGESVLGVPVRDQSDCALGTVGDLLVDVGTGALVECRVVPPESDTSAEAPSEWLAVAGQTMTWVLAEEGLLAVVESLPPAAEPQAAPPGYETLFAERKPEVVQGVVTQVEGATDGQGGEFVLLKLREESNLLHRVLLGPATFLADAPVALEVGALVAVEGLATRDEKGKLWIGSRLRRGEATLRLRDAEGRPLWGPREAAAPAPRDELPAPVSVRDLIGADAVTSDGEPLKLGGFVFDAGRGEVPFVRIPLEDGERLLPISGLKRAPEGAWLLQRSRAELATLPVLSAQGQLLSGTDS